MIIDRYTKAVMTVIAVALLMIGLNPWIAPTKAYAELGNEDSRILRKIYSATSNIDGWMGQLITGKCRNDKIC